MTPAPAARDETACNSDDSTADGIEGNHTRQHERQDDGGSATLPVALGAYEHDFRDAEENCDGEERSAGLREPKPMAEPSPIGSYQSHVRILGQTNELHRSGLDQVRACSRAARSAGSPCVGSSHHAASYLDDRDRVRVAMRVDANNEVQLICKHPKYLQPRLGDNSGAGLG